MTDQAPRPAVPFLDFVQQNKFLIIGFAAIVAAGVEARMELFAIRKETNIHQELRADINLARESLGAQARDYVKTDGRLTEVEKHIKPEAIQRWGEIQYIVETNAAAIADIERELRAGSFGPR